MNEQGSCINRLVHEVNGIAEQLTALIHLEDEKDTVKIRDMFHKCFINTAETTVEFIDKDNVFVITGDIKAMWLRDSSCQVVHYLPFADECPEIQNLIKLLIAKQFQYIQIDPYANAFMKDNKQKSKYSDITASTDWSWERKYELDSLCYPIWLLYQYYLKTEDSSVFTDHIHDALYRILNLWKKEQHHETESDYTFERPNRRRESDTLPFHGKGSPVSYTGMIWSGFRPSDDACKYGYLIPANMFAVVVLKYVQKFANDIYKDEALKSMAKKLREEVEAGIEQYGVYHHKKYGDIYAYETDGRGNYNLMDDANVPSLLSLLWLGFCSSSDPLYQNTRSFVLSKDNPYYFEGKYARGIGSPHTPDRYIWPISLTMQGLTAEGKEEKSEMLKYLMNTDAATEYMHEGFDCDEPKQYTRSWFAWANSLFSLFIMEYFEVRKN